MKLKKSAWIGLSAVASAVALGGAGMIWLPPATAQKENPAGAPAGPLPDDEKSPALPLPLKAGSFPSADAVPRNPIRDGGLEMPSPATTVVRGNDRDGPMDDEVPSLPDEIPQPPTFQVDDDHAFVAAVSDSGSQRSGGGAVASLGDSTYGGPAAEPLGPADVDAPAAPLASAGNQAFQPYGAEYAAPSPPVTGPRQVAADLGPTAVQSVPGSDSPAAFGSRYGGQYEPGAEADAPPSEPFDPGQPALPPSQPAYDPSSVAAPAPYADASSPLANQPPSATSSNSPARNEFGVDAPFGGPPAELAGSTVRPLVPPTIQGLEAAEVPGPRRLEGPQTPSLSVERFAPAEIQVNIPATLETVVRNVGAATAQQVLLVDRVPQGTQLIKATPEAHQTPEGQLVWQFDSIEPGDEVVVEMELLPQSEGEIGSVAEVHFQTATSVRTICTRPLLSVEHSAPARALIGEEVVFAITVKNPGSGDARGVVIEEDVPPGLAHAAGRALEYALETLRAGEERQLELVLQADQAGTVENVIRVRAEGGLVAEDRLALEVTAPELSVAIRGPTRRYLERQATFEVTFSNPGTAPATNVDLVGFLPKGLEFVSADNKGKYDPQNHAIYWSLEELPAGHAGAVLVTALPIETGEQQLRVEGRGDLSLSHRYDHPLLVEALTELEFTVQDVQDPIEVGSETTYEIRVINRGSKAATNIQVAAALPPQISPIAADGATPLAVRGQQVVAEPIDQLAPQSEAIYRIKVQGQQPGDHVINVQLVSDEVAIPVTKQESTKVYADR